MSREAILGGISAVLGSHAQAKRAAAVARRIEALPHHALPERASRPSGERKAQLIGCLEAQSTTVIEVAAAADIPAATLAYLDENRAPLRLRLGADPRLTALPWERAPGLIRLAGAAGEEDTAALSHGLAGIAETGTLLLASGPDNPASLAFLPETHIIALSEKQIVGSYEEAFALLRAELGRRRMPRALNLVSGASRTGDIGGRIVLGAHGPRRLAVIIYGTTGARDLTAARGNPGDSA